ncbi:ABC transporter permease [Dactylosporangium sp. NPDC048998]|uniref:ABC transporter permease n=1 Tax=Dactylosporangium sp. NPDC048998 TaxID=3363976 RepID=UPI00371D209E
MSALTHRPPAVNRPDGRESATGRAGGVSGMVWLTWRQHRWALLGSLVLTAVLVGWMVYLSIDMTSLYHQCHDTACPPFSPQRATLWADFGPIRQAERLGLVVRYLPLLIGVFIGVPVLAREHEQRTLLLAWSQDVSPVRWLWTKLALLGLFVATLTAVLSAATQHLAHVYSNIVGGGLFDESSFLVTGMLPLASGVCWFAVGVALGAVIRRTLPAIFAVIAGFIGLMLGVQWRYPTLMKPLSVYQRLGQPGPRVADPNALIVAGQIQISPDSVSNVFDSPGHEVTYADLHRMCPNLMEDPNSTPDCLARNHLLTYMIYQPSSRIPAFHLILDSAYLGLAAVALAAVWLIVRRTSLSAG